ncbi:MAG: SusC/RagA family TonB-linked outer membrane protein [Flavobacteriaceae bacterium]|tara:strand:- start:301 stop:3423 length:3123 start_codon:yes stop_codon:yes gene_type:complete
MKNKLLKKLLLPMVMLFGSFVYAQSVSGVVSDASGPLPGVNVIVKGTTTGSVTNFDGEFQINANTGDRLVFSFLGYLTKELVVTGNTLNVTLEEDAAQLDEVVVIGYGSTTVKDATGSVASVRSGDFNKGVIASPEQLIQGKTAGVQISQSSGAPGAAVNIRIRGTASIRSNNNPLFVVDGIPLAGDNTSADGADIGFGSSGASNPLNFINPNDIESISILKDASSTAIYGSRGANGVVIITTKSGKGAQGDRFEYNSTVSVSKDRKRYDVLNRDQFLSAYASYDPQTGIPTPGVINRDPSGVDYGANTDWQDYLLRTAISNNHSLAYANSHENGDVRATFGYGLQNGIIRNSGLERITGRLNANHRFFDNKLKIGIQTSFSQENNFGPGLSGSAGFRGDLLGAAYSANPTWPTDPDFDETNGQANPATFFSYVTSDTRTTRYLLNGFADYQFTPELSGKVNLGYDKSNSNRNIAASSLANNIGDGIFGEGRAYRGDVFTKNQLMEITLNYNKEFGNSKLDVLAGYSYQKFNRNGFDSTGWGFSNTGLSDMYQDMADAIDIVGAGVTGSYQQYGYTSSGVFVNRLFPTPTTTNQAGPNGVPVKSLAVNTYDVTDEIQSYFARVNYTLADKYLFTATVRADGSSKFGESNQYGYFPSGAVAWKINEEDFIGDNVSTLKLRVSGGITGNQDGLGYGNFVQRERYEGAGIDNGGVVNVPGLQTVSFPNSGLRWEETISYGVGLDFGFNNDRLSGSIDVYRRETNDLLFRIDSAQPAPQPFVFTNLDATLLNQGIEFAIDYDVIDQEDLTWNLNFNVAYNENELQNFGGLIPAGTIYGQGLSQAFSQILAGGQPLFSYFVREFEGFDSNGQPIGDNQTFVGKSALPNVTGGLSTSVNYKNWDFSAYFNSQFGGYNYFNTQNALFTGGSIFGGRNVTTDVPTNGESGIAEAAVSTRFLYKSDFVRLQNATLGYNFNLKEGAAFTNLRIFVNGQNLFVITDYPGLDPEVNTAPNADNLLNGLPTAGIDYAAYPNPRTITFGLNAQF